MTAAVGLVVSVRAVGRRYTAAEDRLLIRWSGRISTHQQAALLGRPYFSVIARRRRLARRGALGTYARRWTAEDDDYLREHFGVRPTAAIARSLRRTTEAIELHASRIGVSRRQGAGWNLHDVAELFGIHPSDVLRRWVRWGLIRGRRSVAVRAGRYPLWVFAEREILRFIRRYPWHYERRRITHPYFAGAAEAAWRKDPLLTTAEAAVRLGLSRGRVIPFARRRGWAVYSRHDPSAPRAHGGRAPLFVRAADVDALLASRERQLASGDLRAGETPVGCTSSRAAK